MWMLNYYFTWCYSCLSGDNCEFLEWNTGKGKIWNRKKSRPVGRFLLVQGTDSTEITLFRTHHLYRDHTVQDMDSAQWSQLSGHCISTEMITCWKRGNMSRGLIPDSQGNKCHGVSFPLQSRALFPLWTAGNILFLLGSMESNCVPQKSHFL